MLELEEALARVLAAMPAARRESVRLSDAAGRVLARKVCSPMDLPVFDNSAMDGYALRAADVVCATPSTPVRLRLAGKVVAGQVFAGAVKPGCCVRLFTGSPMPAGADAVAMQEDTRVDSGTPVKVLI